MSDNTQLNTGTGGDLIATDELDLINGSPAPAGLKVQRTKVGFGPDGSLQDVSEQNPMPTVVYGEMLDAIEALRMAVHSLSRNVGMAYPDASGRLRVNVETGSLTAALAANQTLATLSTLTNQTQLGSIAANDQVPALMHLQADSLRRNITVT